MARRTEKYDRALAATHEVVNGHDPVGLIAIGAPEDEYYPEVPDLVRLVLSATPINEQDVDAVWIRWFGEDYAMAGSEKLGALTRDLQSVQDRFAKE